MAGYGNLQDNAGDYIPVRLSNGAGFYIASGGGGGSGPPYAATPKGFVFVPNATLLAAYALIVPTGGVFALVQVLNGDVQWRDDGVAPTAALGGGMVIYSGQSIVVSDVGESAWEAIASQGTPVLLISYYA